MAHMKDPNSTAERQSNRPDPFMLGISDLLRCIDNSRISHLRGLFFVTRVFSKPDQIAANEHYLSLTPFALFLEPRLGRPPMIG
jgi:hypothetical protein